VRSSEAENRAFGVSTALELAILLRPGGARRAFTILL
jgi:hypothetical protein